MDWHDCTEAGEMDLFALGRVGYSLPRWNNRGCIRLLRRYCGACAYVVAASWLGMAVSSAEGTEAHVETIYYWQCAVPLEYAEREMLNVELKDSVTDIHFRFIQFSLGVYEGREFLDGSALKELDWNTFYEFAKKQTLVGVVFDMASKNYLRMQHRIWNC